MSEITVNYGLWGQSDVIAKTRVQDVRQLTKMANCTITRVYVTDYPERNWMDIDITIKGSPENIARFKKKHIGSDGRPHWIIKASKGAARSKSTTTLFVDQEGDKVIALVGGKQVFRGNAITARVVTQLAKKYHLSKVNERGLGFFGYEGAVTTAQYIQDLQEEGM